MDKRSIKFRRNEYVVKFAKEALLSDLSTKKIPSPDLKRLWKNE